MADALGAGVEFTNGGEPGREAEEASVSLPSASIRVGKCYLMDTGKIRRVILHEQGKVVVHEIDQSAPKRGWPRRFVVKRDTFAAHVVKEVACPPDPNSGSKP